jgi:hypothetical protein
MDKPTARSWMWEFDGGVEGADLDLDSRTVNFFRGLGCACDDSPYEQTFEDFLKRGAVWVDPPPEVEQEMRAAVEWYLMQPEQSAL